MVVKESWLVEVMELVAGRRTGDGTETGLVAGTGALTEHVMELEAEADDRAGVMTGGAAGF